MVSMMPSESELRGSSIITLGGTNKTGRKKTSKRRRRGRYFRGGQLDPREGRALLSERGKADRLS